MTMRLPVGLSSCLIVFLLGSALPAKAQPPTISSFAPNPICQGEAVTISGSGFTGATSVYLGSQYTGSFTVKDDNTIIAAVPTSATSGSIVVNTPRGSANVGGLTILPAPVPGLTHVSPVDAPFTNCNGNNTYLLNVSNNSYSITGTGNNYTIDWGDGTAVFTQTDWPVGAQTSHQYTSQGYFTITLKIAPPNGCVKTATYQFYNGANPIASFSTTQPTTGLCVPAQVQFQLGNWFNNSAGTTYRVNFGDGTPAVTLSHPLNGSNSVQLVPHTYTTTSCPGGVDFTATLQAINGCFTTTYTLNQIIIRIKPTAAIGLPTTPACVNTPVCLTNQTKNGYTGNSCSPAATYLWDFGDNTTSTAFTPPCHQYASAGTYTVKLSASNTACGADVTQQQVTVLDNSPAPTVSATPVAYCKGETASPLTATGTNLLWYTAPTGGTGSPTAPTPSTNTTGTFTWYVSQSLASNCEGPRVPVSVVVNPIPTVPGVPSPVQLCLGQTAAPLTATGTGLLWYTTATGGVGSSTAPVPPTTAVGSTTWWVSQTTTNCEGPRAAIVVNVGGPPVAPTVVTPVNYCQFQTASPLSATGSGLLWYTTATGGTATTTPPIPSTSTPGTTTYYVSQGSGCGESPRSSIDVNVNAPPSATIAYSPATLCNFVSSATSPNPPIPVTQTGNTGGTYTITPSTGLPIDATTGQLTPSGATAGTYTIRYSIAGAPGCGLFTTSTTVIVNATPTAGISYPNLCTSDAITAVRLTGSPGGTYSSTSGLSIDATTGSINPGASTPGTYTVTYGIAASAPCPGFSTTTTLTITQAPAATIAYSPAILCNVVSSATNPNPPITVTQTGNSGGTYTITPATGLPIDATTGQLTPSGATPGTYTIQYHVVGTGACRDFMTTTTVTVNATPTAGISYPNLCTSDAVTAVRLTGSPGGTYASTTGLSIDATTGSINPGASTAGTYTVTYTIAPSAPCPGYTTTTTLTITQAPTATISYPAVLCNFVSTASTPNPPIPVTQTGNSGGAYTITPSTGLPIDATTGQLSPSGATPGSYTVQYHVAGTGACKDFMTTTTVTINATPIATIQYPTAPYCRATTNPQAVVLTGNTGGVFSGSPGLSINATTGSINPSLSQPGVYTVTYTIAPSSPCPGYTTTTTVEIDDYPVLTFTIPVQSICSGSTASYVPISTIPNTRFQWFVVGSLPAGVTGISSGNSVGSTALLFSFTNTGAAPQKLTIRVVPTNPSQNPCTGPSYDLTLTVNPITPAPAPDTFYFCLADPATPLNVQPLAGTTLKWYDAGHAPLPGAPTISTSMPARFTYYITQTNSTGCESPATQVLAIVNPTPKIVGTSYSNPTACGVPSGSIVLKLLDLNNNPIPNTPMTVHYNKFNIPLTVLLRSDASGNITIPLSAGTYSNIYVEASGCVSATIPDVFILKDPSPPSTPDAGYNPPLCSSTPLTLTALAAASSVSGPLRYVWAGPAFGPLADTVDNSVITFPSVKVSDAGTYIVYAIQNNCISLTTSITVAVKQAPSQPTIITQNPLCVGDNLHLQAFSTIPPPDQALEFVWKGPGTGFPVNGSVAGINNVQLKDGGDYSVTVTSPATGCSSTTDTLIRIGAYPILKFAQDTLSLPTGFLLNLAPIVVNADDPGILPMAKFVWTPSADIACNDAVCASPIATIKENGCYNVTGTNSYGCSGSAVICVKVFCQSSQVFIPNAFAPRGNIAANRILMVRATGISSVRSFRIFNRWGKVVFERNNFPPNSPDFGWDGTIDGRMADSGVYVYTVEVICENGVPYTFKGNVTLF